MVGGQGTEEKRKGGGREWRDMRMERRGEGNQLGASLLPQV